MKRKVKKKQIQFVRFKPLYAGENSEFIIRVSNIVGLSGLPDNEIYNLLTTAGTYEVNQQTYQSVFDMLRVQDA